MFNNLPAAAHSNPVHFVQWWNDNPILVGGDRYSECPGLEVSYIAHSNDTTFEFKLTPVQKDRLNFTQGFLQKLLACDDQHHFDVLLKQDALVVAKGVLQVDSQRRWAYGEGEWILMQGNPRSWNLICQALATK